MDPFVYNLVSDTRLFRKIAYTADTGLYFSVSGAAASVYKGVKIVTLDLPAGTACLVIPRRLSRATMSKVFELLDLGDFQDWNSEFFKLGKYNSRNRELGDVLAWAVASRGCKAASAIWLAGEGFGGLPHNTDEFILPLETQAGLKRMDDKTQHPNVFAYRS